ncbi:caspase family protein [Haliangium sp.]|uniref:caspase family protein n=1 Tax=Haliangium sp. TaxID=2663208 RepID=UPI003D108B00
MGNGTAAAPQTRPASDALDATPLAPSGVLEAGAILPPPDGHLARLNCLSFSPDGRLLVSGGSDASLIVWDLTNSQITARYSGHRGYVGGCAFMPDGRRVVSGGWGGEVHVWDSATGAHEMSLVGLGPADDVYAIMSHPDGREVIAGTSTGTVMAWTMGGPTPGQVAFHDRTLAGDDHDSPVRVVGYVEDSHAGGDPRRFAGGDAAATIVFGPDEPQAVPFKSISGTPLPGGRLALGGEREVVVATPGAAVRRISPPDGHTEWVYGLAANPRGDYVLAGDRSGSVRVWPVAGGPAACIVDLGTAAHARPGATGVRTVAWDPTGARLAVGSSSGALRIFDARACVGGARLQPTQVLRARRRRVSAVAAGSNELLLGDSGRVSAWATPTMAQSAAVSVQHGEITALLALPSGGWVSSSLDHTLHVEQFETSTSTGRAAATTTVDLKRIPWALAPWGPDAVLAADDDGRLTAVATHSGQTRVLAEVDGPLYSVTTHPRRREAVAGGAVDELVHVSGSTSTTTRWPYPFTPPASVTALSYGRDGSLAAASTDGSVAVLDADDGHVLQRLHGLSRPVQGLVVTDAHVWAGGSDGALARWPRSGGPAYVIDEGTKILDLALSPDEGLLVAGLADGRAVVRRLPQGELVAELIPLRDGSWAALHGPRDGERRVVLSAGASPHPDGDSLAASLHFYLPHQRRVLALGQSQTLRFGGVSTRPVGSAGAILAKATLLSPNGRPSVTLDGRLPLTSVHENNTDLVAYEIEVIIDDPDRKVHTLRAVAPGRNDGREHAPDDDREVAEVEIPLPPDPTAVRARATTGKVLSIGQHRYQHPKLSPLPGAVADARAVADVFSRDTTWAVTPARRRVLTDVDAEDLTREVERFFADASSEDNLLLYFAGHGLVSDGEGYLLPVDYVPGQHDRALSASALWAMIERSPARSVLIVLDACRSGSFAFPTQLLAGRAERLPLPVMGAGGKRVAILSSTSTGRNATETADGGAFTRRWLRAVTDPAGARRGDKISLGDTYRDAYDTDQAPRLAGNHDQLVLAIAPSGTPVRGMSGNTRSDILHASWRLLAHRKLTGAAELHGRTLVIDVDFGHDTDYVEAVVRRAGKGHSPINPPTVFSGPWARGSFDTLHLELDKHTRLPDGKYEVVLTQCIPAPDGCKLAPLKLRPAIGLPSPEP